MAEVIKIKLGQASKMTLILTPVFDVSQTLIIPQGSREISPGNNVVSITIILSRTSITTGIKGVVLYWVFMGSRGNTLCTIRHPGEITLSKDGFNFSTGNVTVPIEDILQNHRDTLLGKKGTLQARLSIENMEPLDIVPGQPINWDFSYDFIVNSTTKLADLNGRYFIMGEKLFITYRKGYSLPASYKAYLFFWENDSGGDINIDYSCKINTDHTAIFRYGSRDEQSTILTFTKSYNLYYYPGCDSNLKLNYGNYESSITPDLFEFNAMVIITPDLRNTNGAFIRIKDLPYKKITLMDNFYVTRPTLSFWHNTVSDGSAKKYFARLSISSLAPNVSHSNIYFFLVKKEDNGTFTKVTEPQLIRGPSFEYDFTLLDQNNRDWPWPKDNVPLDSVLDMTSVYIKFGIRFILPAYARPYKLVCPLVELLSDTEKNSIPVMLKDVDRIGGISLKKRGNKYEPDREYKWHYIAFDFDLS